MIHNWIAFCRGRARAYASPYAHHLHLCDLSMNDKMQVHLLYDLSVNDDASFIGYMLGASCTCFLASVGLPVTAKTAMFS